MVRGGEWRKGRLLGTAGHLLCGRGGRELGGGGQAGKESQGASRTGIYLPSPIPSSKQQVPPTHPFLGSVGYHVDG